MSQMKFIYFLLFFLPECVDASCTITAPSFVFPNYDSSQPTPATATGNLVVNCTDSGLISYTLSSSTGNGTYTQRYLLNGATHLNYNLYVNPTHSNIWGNGTSGSSLIAAVNQHCQNTPCVQVVYGRIDALQNVGPGAYSDNIAITLTY
jgi:spore coat protein U-like protein